MWSVAPPVTVLLLPMYELVNPQVNTNINYDFLNRIDIGSLAVSIFTLTPRETIRLWSQQVNK
jgi:hypothetical protein